MTSSNPATSFFGNRLKSIFDLLFVGFLFIHRLVTRTIFSAKSKFAAAGAFFRSDEPTCRPRAAIYVRTQVHDDDPQNNAYRQIFRCAQYAESIGADVIEVFHDRCGGRSVSGRQRQALLEMLNAAERKRYTIVIVEELDRLARDFVISNDFYAMIRVRGAELHTASTGPVKTLFELVEQQVCVWPDAEELDQ
jgi:hypothetical protein